MYVGSPSFVQNQIKSSLNYFLQTDQSADLNHLPFVEGGGKYFSRSCIPLTRLACCIMMTLDCFKISMLIYLTWFWKMIWCLFHMLFPNSNQISFSKSMHLLRPNYISPYLYISSVFIQVQNFSMVTSFFSLSIHWSPTITFSNSFHSVRTVLYFSSAGPLRMRWV